LIDWGERGRGREIERGERLIEGGERKENIIF